MNDVCLLSLVVAPQIEDAITDWLLEREQVSGFSSLPISGHGVSENALSLAEQVAGKRRQIRFELHLSLDAARQVLAGMKQDFGGSGIHFWLVPVVDAGHLD